MPISNDLRKVSSFINNPVEDKQLHRLGKALANLASRDRRQHQRTDKFTPRDRAAVFEKLIGHNTPHSRMIAREMIRRDLIPAEWDVAKVRAEIGSHPEMQHYISTLEARLSKAPTELTGEEILRLKTNQFTKRTLKEPTNKVKWEQLNHDPALLKAAAAASKVKARYAKQQDYNELSKILTPEDFDARKAIAKKFKRAPSGRPSRLTAIKPNVMGQAIEFRNNGIYPKGFRAPTNEPVIQSPDQGHSGVVFLRQGASHTRHTIHEKHSFENIVRQSAEMRFKKGVESGTVESGTEKNPLQSSPSASPAMSNHVEVPAAASPSDVEAKVVTQNQSTADNRTGLPPTVRDIEYRSLGREFHSLGPRERQGLSESQRFQAAALAVKSLIESPDSANEAPVFKHIPDLVHRVFGEITNLQNPTTDALDTIREALRGGGKLTPTAQKMMVWMAIVSDPKCLRIDDPSAVAMREDNGKFQVKEKGVDGFVSWRPAGDGTLDVAYTKSLIAHWFKNADQVKFDDGILGGDGALRNIRVQGPLYVKNDSGGIELAPNLSVSMGKNRLNDLGNADILKLDNLAQLRQTSQAKQQSVKLEFNDFEHLPEKPINLGNLTEIPWQNPSADSAAELYALHATGMIKIDSSGGKTAQQAWTDIRAAIAQGHVKQLDKLLLTHVKRGENATNRTFIHMGGPASSNSGDDLIKLQLHHYLRETLNIDLPEVYSDQNAHFDQFVLANKNNDIATDYEFPGEKSNERLDRFRDSNLTENASAMDRLNRHLNHPKETVRADARERLGKYLPSHYQHLELRRVSDDSHTIHSNGLSNPADTQALEDRARTSGIKISASASSAEKNARINEWFHAQLNAMHGES
jgi:hypothetical protein